MKFPNLFKAILRALLPCVLSIVSTAQARKGGFDSGGGDPLANEFIQIGRFLQTTQANRPIEGVNASAASIATALNQVERSLDGKNPLVIFPEGETVDCLGSPKLGCVKDGKIHFAREGWSNALLKEKIEVAAMEIFMFMGLKDRYQKAKLVSQAMAPRLVLSKGNVLLPTTTDQVRGIALRLLNTKKNDLREKLLQAHYDNCAELSFNCAEVIRIIGADTYRFTEKDIVSIGEVGSNFDSDPCKTEVCEGADVENREFAVVIRIETRSRWSRGFMAAPLSLTFTRSISQKNGSISKSMMLTRLNTILPEEKP